MNDLPSLDPELYRHLIFLKVMFLHLPSISLSVLAYIKFVSHANRREENNASCITINFVDNLCFLVYGLLPAYELVIFGLENG